MFVKENEKLLMDIFGNFLNNFNMTPSSNWTRTLASQAGNVGSCPAGATNLFDRGVYLSFLVGPGHVLKLPFPSLKTSRGIATGSLSDSYSIL